MEQKQTIRNFFLKIGFVLMIAMSFSPVDALAEPAVISSPVQEHSELIIDNPESTNSFEVWSHSKPSLNPKILPDQERKRFFLFKLIHYEKLVAIKINNQSKVHRVFIPGYLSFLKNNLPATALEESNI